MHKISHLVGESWVEHTYPPVFDVQDLEDGGERLRVGVPGGDEIVLRTLIHCLQEPFFILYVLHTPRGEGQPGRYQSSLIDRSLLDTFLARHRDYLSGDSRYDLWVHSPESCATVVWDRHNLVHAYGPLEQFRRELRALGFYEAPVTALQDHMHHFRPEFDDDAARVLAAFDWTRAPLRPEDLQ
jgi:hypothetical protein